MIRVVYKVTHKPLRLGDAVAKVAQPIARAVDKLVGTNLQNCGGCKRRQEALNNLFKNDPPLSSRD